MGRPTAETRQRRWAPKRKTGCDSCKKRRQRCDEGKPSCYACVKHNVPCEYVQISGKNKEQQSLPSPPTDIPYNALTPGHSSTYYSRLTTPFPFPGRNATKQKSEGLWTLEYAAIAQPDPYIPCLTCAAGGLPRYCFHAYACRWYLTADFRS